MLRRLPILATAVVFIAAAIMVRLGFWQLDRMAQKEALLARYAAVQAMSSEVPWPRDAAGRDLALFRYSTITCAKILSLSAKAGRNDQGISGWVHKVRCALAAGGEGEIVIGWSSEPAQVKLAGGVVTTEFGPNIAPRRASWSGGEVRGLIAPAGKKDVQLIASAPFIGLGANARPDPRDIPNNHFSYAVQWFLFAGVALVIYLLAVRRRLSERIA